jgi:hypothetical protein
MPLYAGRYGNEVVGFLVERDDVESEDNIYGLTFTFVCGREWI